MARWGARTSGVPGYFRIEQQTFDDLENIIRNLELSGKRVATGMNDLCKVLAFVGLAQAQKRSRGPVDPRGYSGPTPTPSLTSRVGYSPPGASNPVGSSKAWQIPVRRITGAYYRGWKVRRITFGVWQVYNESREAYYIEYGIHVSNRRVRRPIAKLSLLATLKFAKPIVHRFTDWVIPWGRISVQSPAMTMGIHPAAGTSGGTFPNTFGGHVF